MKQVLVLITITFPLFSYSQNKKAIINTDIQIIEKYKAVETLIDGDTDYTFCHEDSKAFKNMGEYDCAFTIDKYKFTILDKFILDKKGKLKGYWNYLPEGPLTYNLEELKADPKLFNSVGGKNMTVRLLKNGYQIKDKGKILTIEKVFTDEKLILIKQKSYIKKRGMRILFQYK